MHCTSDVHPLTSSRIPPPPPIHNNYVISNYGHIKSYLINRIGKLKIIKDVDAWHEAVAVFCSQILALLLQEGGMGCSSERDNVLFETGVVRQRKRYGGGWQC